MKFNPVFLALISFHIYGVKGSGRSCGVDNSPVEAIYEGEADVGRYPWMGMLYYPVGEKRVGAAAVLVTRQAVITSAYDVDKMSKRDFRARARVVLGNPCGTNEIRIRDYSFHPDYKSSTYSAIALVQLEIDHVRQELRPICGPPEAYLEPQIYAMTMFAGCQEPKVKIYKMKDVDIETCVNYYRKSGLDMDSMWPTHTTCARAMAGGECLWRSGTLLTIKQKGRWRLIGISELGPGCGAPARFLDYGKYFGWVRRSFDTIGFPAVTRIADNAVILRRTLSSIQRFGPCDYEETKLRLYTERQKFSGGTYKIAYNLSLYANVEYACIMFKAESAVAPDPFPGIRGHVQAKVMESTDPIIKLKRWCAGPPSMCFGFQFVDIHFQVQIIYERTVYINVSVFGREARIISPGKALIYQNALGVYPYINDTFEIISRFNEVCNDTKYLPWHYDIFKKLYYP